MRLSKFWLYFVPIATTLLFLLIFVFHIFVPTDYDLGWHLRYGKDVLHDGQIWRNNTYSSEMHNEPYINSSWLLDVVRYPFYESTGLMGHSLLGALVVTATFGILALTFRFSLWQSVILFPLLSYALYPVNFHSFRGQTLSSLFMVILYYGLVRYEEGKTNKYLLYFLIPFFMVWTNLNGQFLMGLAIFGVWVGVRVLTNIHKPARNASPSDAGGLSTINYQLLTVFLLSLLVTLINPYTYHLYTDEVFLHGQSAAMQYISEWLPITEKSGLTYYILLIWGVLFMASIFFLGVQKKLLRYLPYILIGIALYIASFKMGRYVWSMFTLTSPFLASLIGLLEPKKISFKIFIITILLISMSYFVFAKELPSHKLDKNTWETYCSFTGCSIQAADFVKENYSKVPIWTDYNLGGWLIWNYPEIVPAIDGRMPLWEDSKNRYSPFMDTYFPLEQGISDPDLSKYDVFMIRNTRSLVRFESLVKSKKWEMVFRDNNVTVFARNKKISL